MSQPAPLQSGGDALVWTAGGVDRCVGAGTLDVADVLCLRLAHWADEWEKRQGRGEDFPHASAGADAVDD